MRFRWAYPLVMAAVFTAGAAAAEPAGYWNGDPDFPLACSDGGEAWYLHRSAAKITANDAAALVFSADVFVVQAGQDPNAYEFRRYWFRKPQSEDPYTVYVRQGDAGEWTALSLADPEDRTAAALFLAGWEAAAGFPYGLAAPEG